MSKQKLLSNKKGIGFDDFVPLLILGFSSVIIVAVIMVSSIILEANKNKAVIEFKNEQIARNDFLAYTQSTLKYNNEDITVTEFVATLHADDMLAKKSILSQHTSTFVAEHFKLSQKIKRYFFIIHNDGEIITGFDEVIAGTYYAYSGNQCEKNLKFNGKMKVPSHHYGNVDVELCFT